LIRWIELEGVRNLSDQRVEFEPGLNLVAGANAQGKSSLLEAVYLLGTTRSFRTGRPEQAVRHGLERLILRGEAERGRAGVLLALMIGRQQRKTRVDGRPAGLEDYLGKLDVVAFSSRALRTLVGAPAERRRFLDRGAALLGAGHIRALRDFRRALAQRNRLLSDLRDRGAPPTAARAALEPWNGPLASAAAEVSGGRRDFALALAARVGEAPSRLLPERCQLEVAYRPGPGYDALDGEDGRRALERRLEACLEDDLRLGYTTTGPQRDDLTLKLEGKDLLAFGSSGQLRATMIALLLAQMEIIRERKGSYPVLLLDDVDSDIDEERYATLMESLGGSFQAIVATSKGSLAGVEPRRRLLLEDGRARPLA
jgi:DNA replication and repair protein RecF